MERIDQTGWGSDSFCQDARVVFHQMKFFELFLVVDWFGQRNAFRP